MKRWVAAAALTVVILGAFIAPARAAVSDAAVLFLRIAPEARSGGMGEAFVAISDDLSATHWNPAGLGEYPLAHAWYTVKLTDDTRLTDLAEQAAAGKLSPTFFESLQSWQVKGNSVSRLVEGQWVDAAEIKVDPSRSLLATLTRRMAGVDKDKLKAAVRQIALLNSGVAFDEISGHRTSLVRIAPRADVARINAMIERLLLFWQDGRLNIQTYSVFKQKVGEAAADQQLLGNELTELESIASGCETAERPASVKVPYSILLSVWRGFNVPWERQIRKISVMENSVPNENFSKYDIWALTSFGLMRYNGTEWVTGDIIQPRRNENLKDIVARALGSAKDEIVLPRLERVARANNKFSRERLAELRTTIEAALPAVYDGREELLKNLSLLDEAWLGCRLDDVRLTSFVDGFSKAFNDSTITEAEADRLTFALEKALRDRLPSEVQVPFEAVFEGELLDIGVDFKTLYVGTSTGLYRYNGRSWERFSTGGDSTAIWCVRVVKRNYIWFGADNGVRVLRDGKWSAYGAAEGITAGPIRNIYVRNERLAWAATADDLFSFNGSAWSNKFNYTTTVSDSGDAMFARIYGGIDEQRLELERALMLAKHPTFSTEPKAGVVIDLPHKPVFEGQINDIEMDKNENLWVATDFGLKKFDGSKWTSYGYKAIKVDSAMTIEQLAEKYLKTSDPDRIKSFVELLRRKNLIQQGELQVGRVVYVFANPAGSTIRALQSYDGRIYAGSIYGLFSYDDGRWERYYHEDLNQADTRDIASASGELWFASADRVVIAAKGQHMAQLSYFKWLPNLASDIAYAYGSYVQPLGSLGAVGGNFSLLSYGEIPTTGENSSQITGVISPYDVALTLSFGTRASRSLAVGLSAKIIYSRLSVQGAGREVGEGSGTSFAVDGGLIYSPSRRFRIGAAITNLGPDMSYIDAAQSDALPRNLAVGIAYRLLDSPYNRLTWTGEVNKLVATLSDDLSTELKEAIFNTGVEYWYGSLLALRAGYIYDREGDIKAPTVGVGLQYKGMYHIDFAYIPSSKDTPLANTLRSTVSFKWR